MIKLYFLLLFIFYSLSISASELKQRLLITTPWVPPVSLILQQILDEALKHQQMKLQFDWVSGERSLLLVEQGLTDGDCCRIPEVVLKEYTGLIMVPERIFSVRFNAFAKNSSIMINKWEDLNNYSVAAVFGYKIVIQNLQRIKHKNYHIVENHDAAFKMLQLNRVDLVIVGYSGGLNAIYNNQFKDIHVIEPSLANRDLYLMLNRKNQHLIKPLAKTIRQMREDGSIISIQKNIMQAYQHSY